MIVASDRTQLSPHRLLRLKQYANEVAHLEGDVAEVGVWKGGSAKWLCHLFPERTVYLFDTFKGMPTPDPKLDGHREGDFGDTSLESVRSYLHGFPNALFCAGMFPKTAEGLAGPFVLVHVDCDLHTSTRDAIEFFWPRLASGGIMVFDDYKSGQCAGATKAIDEFARSVGVELEGNAPHEAAIARKA